MSTVHENVQELIAMVEKGQIVEAFHKFYAPDVHMQENRNEPRMGFDTNLQYEQNFVNSVAEVHENKANRFLADDTHAVIDWVFEMTNKEGHRVRLEQISLQTWKDGKVVHERFFYDPTSMMVNK